MIDRGAKRAVWSDDEEQEREISLGEKKITKKIKTGDQNTITGKQLEDKLRSQVRGSLKIVQCLSNF